MTLGPYKGIRAKKPVISVQEQEILDILRQKQLEHSIVRDAGDRPARCGDQVTIDFDGTCEDTPIPQSRGRDFVLVLGSHSFIHGFEDQIIGRRAGEIFEIRVTFPETYFMKELRGKPGVFRTTLKRIRIPEYQPLDDDFAKDFSDHETLAEWKEAIREQLLASRQAEAKEKLSRDILSAIIRTSEIPVNQSLKKELMADFYQDFKQKLKEKGFTPGDYYRKTGRKEADLLHKHEERAVRVIQEHSILYAIAEAEHIGVDDVMPFLLKHAVYV